MNQQIAKIIIVTGLVVVGIGFILYFFHDKLKWLGKLPGDIRIEKPNYSLYFPIVTMLLISLILTVLINLFRKP